MKQQTLRIVEHLTIERILNAFVREKRDCLLFLKEEQAQVQKKEKKDQQIAIELLKQKKKLLGTLTYVSEFGHHHYGEQFTITHANGEVAPIESVNQLVELLLEEISSDSDVDTRHREEFIQQIQNSIKKTTLYLETALSQKHETWMNINHEERLRWMEQRLIFGHPFHPTPKSSEGFTQDDLHQYAPELRASFPLSFFAIHPDWMKEEWTDQSDLTNHELFPEEVLRSFPPLLAEGYRLFPMHPWQAEYLYQFDVWKTGIKQGKIVSLNQTGPDVYPTSSVRTVWSPDYPYSLKLPLHVRITHFVRENTPEQLKRSIDASRVVAQLRKKWDYPTLTLLVEKGALQIFPPASVNRNQFPFASANVLFRENPDCTHQVPLVLASLLECWPNQAEPPLFDAIREAVGVPNGSISAYKLAEWLKAYLEVAFIPVLDLFANQGISLEAHVQNSMIHLEQGWPRQFYVRDMEGISISKDQAEWNDYFNNTITPDSPVLYPEETAWERLQYYLITNHLGHLIYVMSYYGQWSEKEAWGVVHEQLTKQMEIYSPAMRRYIQRLLEAPSIRSKANLISRFQNRSDSAIYFDLPNPLLLNEVTVK